MFFRILKKDLKRKKSMNIILLIFIILATTFLASSINSLIAVSESVDYFMEKAKTPDYLISAFDRGENKEFDKWINTSKFISSYDIDRGIMLSKDAVKTKEDGKIKEFEPFGENLLQVQPKKYGKILGDKGEEIILNPGEIAFSLGDKSKNNLEVGDKVIITLGNIKKEFTIKLFTKDAIFGSSMNEMKRVVISEEDYELYKSFKEAAYVNTYYIISDDTAALEKELKGIDFSTIFNVDKSMVNKSFILDMMPSGVLIVVSLCLILIAFLILRFTIIFTLQDDFKEIGVMKAIGLKEFDIKKVYLIKYLAITIIGVIGGLLLSFPFGNILLKQTSGNILMKSSTGNILINIACSVSVVLVVLLFCYTCTRKLNKFSAIDAIRNGSNGESFKGKSKLKLRKFKNIKVPMFIALNDILCNLRRFVVLILTFCIGTILIIIPLNTINTMKDGNIIKLFGVDYSDVLIETDDMGKYIGGATKEEYLKDMENLRESFKDSGIDMELYGEVMYRLKFYSDDKDNSLTLIAFQSQESEANNYNILKGKMPELKNEVAITETVAKKLKVSIGDTIYTQIGKEKKELIVTGLYESMNNMGESVRLNTKMDIDFKYLAIILPFQGNFKGNEEPQILINQLRDKYPSYTFKNSQEYVSRYIGGSLDQLDTMKNLIVLIVLCINTLITILMMKTFITKEKGEIAMLKSVGFRNSSIRLWQSARISIVLVVAIFLGIILSKFLGPVTAGQVFAMLGVHNIVFKVQALEVYIVYPIILLAVTTAIAYLSAGAIKKVDLKEINNME
ncbi:FtsX-like permease family protein [Clostridium homopropionicum DSM 5847]|uniref:FtsX-like permease family protein n=1 Tax=Clostridium homopropionicum DSM 5847 TaxID=1121318 RepID=A0A0L6ZBH8_9CLOT|nr:ABC transporter permease [Clostridium homopropionicum]KOA20334.1 FtsX-like permease family protein [Clostridium homopropionicum DSM 5847]SFG93958.1 putative ABC transport system permease protein [Clostridium homopropionicum]